MTEPTANELLFDELLIHAVELERLKATQTQESDERLKELALLLIAAILASLQSLKRQPVNARRVLLDSFVLSQQQVIAQAYSDIARGNGADLQRLAGIEARAARGMLEIVRKRPGIDPDLFPTRGVVTDAASIAPDLFATEGVLIQGAPAADWWEAQSASLQMRFQTQVSMGVAQDEDGATLAARIDGDEGILVGAQRDAASLIAGGIQAVSHAARQSVFDADSGIESARHCSILDNRTTEICRGRNGLRWSVPSHNPIGHEESWFPPPCHWNCRSILLQEFDGQATIEDVPTFKQWLARKEDAQPGFAADLLGEKRSDLILRGVLDVRDLVDRNFRLLDLDALDELVRKRFGL